MGLELGVVVGELVVKDGDGHAVEDDAEGDAGEGKDAPQVGLREHVAVAHCRNTHLEGKRENENISSEVNINSKTTSSGVAVSRYFYAVPIPKLSRKLLVDDSNLIWILVD